jgi:hypothetical protein
MLCLGLLLTLSTTDVFSQDGVVGVEINDDNDRIDNERIMTSPGESDTRFVSKSGSNTASKDSSSAVNSTTTQSTIPQIKFKAEKPTPTPKATVEKQSKNQDDSILSFNFLYYIIEKYKLQDIVD